MNTKDLMVKTIEDMDDETFIRFAVYWIGIDFMADKIIEEIDELDDDDLAVQAGKMVDEGFYLNDKKVEEVKHICECGNEHMTAKI